MSTKTVEPLKLVPFNSAWISHDKIDIHAIYRRPRFKEDEFGELEREYDASGLPTWDLTGPLPVKQHNRWMAKGFEYVTLANRESLGLAGMYGTIDGNWREYDQHQTGGPWNFKKFLVGQEVVTSRELDELRVDVEEYGSDVVERIRRRTDPNFRLPESLRGVPPGGIAAGPAPDAPKAEKKAKA
jgi:hypothetical protein